MSTTLDGRMEGPNRELGDTAQFFDPDFERYASEMLQSIGAILLGRVTYALFRDYWPKATGPDADRMNGLPKVIVSRTLTGVDWANSRLVRGNVAEEIAKLKAEPGADIALFGSATLGSSLVPAGLIDEYRVLVTPVILGRGAPMFRDLAKRVPLRLIQAIPWASGTVALTYRPVGKHGA